MPIQYSLTTDSAAYLSKRFQAENVLAYYTPQLMLKPGKKNPVIFLEKTLRIKRMMWGIIPYWSDMKQTTYHTYFARVETIETKSVYKKAFHFQRCLIPATSFYLTNHKARFEHMYGLSIKQTSLFAFAGIYNIWVSVKTGEEQYTYAILTMKATSLVAHISNRMPVILSPDNEQQWLDPALVTPSEICKLLPTHIENLSVQQIGMVEKDNHLSPQVQLPLGLNTGT